MFSPFMRWTEHRVQPPVRHGPFGFTLVELLVVIAIIALLIGILLPTLGRARAMATATKSLSNLRQLGIGLMLYCNDHDGAYPAGAMPAVPQQPRYRWVDFLYPYMQNTEVYMSPALADEDRQRMKKPFAHTCNPDGTTNENTIFYGGYGYNYQYLGNGRHDPSAPPPYNAPFHAKPSQIRVTTQTIAIADTNGTKDGYANGEGVYTIDPPLQSLVLGSKGSRRNPTQPPTVGNFGYRGGDDSEPPDSDYRSIPAERSNGRVAVVFCDGHARLMTLQEMDDSDGDGHPDNGYWNGKADPNVR